MDKTIILDMEWTNLRENKKAPVNSRGDLLCHEIIQIGAVLLNEETGGIEEEFCVDVFPFAQGEVNPRIEKLTNIKTSELKKTGRRFKSALLKFQEFLGEEPVRIGTWDTADQDVLRENMQFWKTSLKCSPVYYDLQCICGQYLFPDQKRLNLKTALELKKLTPKGKLHTALGDAVNESRLFSQIPDCMQTFDQYDPAYFYRNIPDSNGFTIIVNRSEEEFAAILKQEFISKLTREEAGSVYVGRFRPDKFYSKVWKDEEGVYRMERVRYSRDRKTLYAYYKVIPEERALRLYQKWKCYHDNLNTFVLEKQAQCEK